jgi:twitching motility protein PilT
MQKAAASAFLTTVIKEAVKQEAADIIFTCGCSPVLKANGGLVRLDSLGKLSKEDLNLIADGLLPKAKQDTLREQRQVDVAYSQEGHRFRVNVFYQRGSVAIAMRYVKNTIHTLKELGLPSIMKEMVENDSGLILLVGPTGSGKSTTMAAMLEHINQEYEKHIITIEDPIEYIYENKKSIVEQREIGDDALSYPEALRSTLREAPDVILLGEMRDLESVSTAITVAETGHLVISTIHANSAASTVDRIIDIFPGDSKEQVRIQLADALLAVFSQRLVPRADGNGQIAIIETMVANPAVRNAIRTASNAQLPNVIQTGSADGMSLLDDQLLKAVERGDITKETALAFAHDRVEIRKQLHIL